MYHIEKTHGQYGGASSANTDKTQHAREARERLTDEFAALLALSPDSGARWKGSVTDLMEITHIAYMQGSVYAADGAPCTFMGLAVEVCAIAHVKTPCNPRACAHQAGLRKGVRRGTFFDRYLRRPSLFNEMFEPGKQPAADAVAPC